MVQSKTRYNQRMADYNRHFNRKKVFLPAVPPGVPKYGYQGSDTSTIALYSIGDQTKKLTDINSIHVIAPELQAENDEHCVWWKIPDDMYAGDDVYVWLLWSPTETTSDGYMASYSLAYSTKAVIDYDKKATSTSEPMIEAASGMDDEISTTVAMSGLKLYAPYRSNRGRIKGGVLDLNDVVTFKIKAPSNPTNLATIAILGIEIDYSRRLRESTIELYE